MKLFQRIKLGGLAWRAGAAVRSRSAGRAMRSRGTVLLLIVGVLAMLAIIAVTYAAIGRGDRATSAAVLRQQRSDDQVGQIADYLNKVIGDSVFATYAEPRYEPGPGGRPRYIERPRLRMFDYPWTDWQMVSVPAALNGTFTGTEPAGSYPFSPTGTWTPPVLDTARPRLALNETKDVREPGTPWIASPEPAWLGQTTSTNRAKLDQITDWLQISNFAPSGNFVNLWNLRNNFNAESGFTTGNSPSSTPRMSDNLTLFQNAQGQMQNAPGSLWRVGAGNADPNIPGHWSTEQRFSFRPMVDTNYPPGDYRYLFNQWADADGDGFADSRWFELTDISNSQRTTATDRRVINLIPSNGRIRWFVAARAIDASGLVNVNTAGSQAMASTETGLQLAAATLNAITDVNARLALQADLTVPIGATPADIDLRRLLTLRDFNKDVLAGAGLGAQGGYAGIPQGPGFEDYSGYTSGATASRSTLIGYSGFEALHQARLFQPSLRTRGPALTFDQWDPANTSATVPVGGTGSAFGMAQSSIDTWLRAKVQNQAVRPGVLTLSALSPLGRLSYYELLGAAGRDGRYASDPSSLASPLPTTDVASGKLRLFSQPFGMSDELELRTYSGINDSSTVTRLEIATGGQWINGQRYGPLRDNRSRETEMSGRLTYPPSQEALVEYFTDVRRLLTTVNGARPLRERPLGVGPTVFDATNNVDKPDYTQLSSVDLKQDLTQDLRQLRLGKLTTAEVQDAIGRIFRVYADALAPFSDSRSWSEPWNWQANTPYDRAGLSYGGRAELAWWMAAHLALNLADSVDRDVPSGAAANAIDEHEPAVATVYFSQQAAATGITATDVNPLLHPDQPANSQTRLSSNPAFLTDAPQGKSRMYGVEPQPFIVQVATLYMYTDAPERAPSPTREDPPSTPVPGGQPTYAKVNISLSPRISNGDFLGEVIAFQLHNPFEEVIFLRRAGQRAKYYIEYSGRYYALAEQNYDARTIAATDLTLDAGETRVFYAINPGTRQQLDQRVFEAWKEAPNDSTVSPPLRETTFPGNDFVFDRFLKKQLGADALNIPMVYRETLQPVTLPPQALTNSSWGSTGLAMEEMDLFADQYDIDVPPGGRSETRQPQLPASTGQRKVVKLWRTVRDTSQPDSPQYDLMADRMRDPSTSAGGTLFGTRPSTTAGTRDITGSQAGDESSTVSTNYLDNSGFTLVGFGSIRRRGFGKAEDIRRGVLPPWCMEVRADFQNVRAAGNPDFPITSLNVALEGDTDVGRGNQYPGGGGTSGEPRRYKSITAWMNSSSVIVPGMNTAAADKRGQLADADAFPYPPLESAIPNSWSIRVGTTRRTYGEVAPEYHAIGPDGRNAGLFSRVGDLLLPLAVGPSFTPRNAATAANAGASAWANSDATTIKEELEWMTLAESLAMSAGYWWPSDPNSMFREFGIDQPAAQVQNAQFAKTDRGHVRIDAFTPYFRTPGQNVPNVRSLGSGVPFALNVMDQVRLSPGIGRSRDSFLGEPRSQAEGSLTEAVPGLANINTTPRSVMRMLPLVAPDQAPVTDTASPTYTASWSQNLPAITYTGAAPTPAPRDLFAANQERYDLATTFAAYRDKMQYITRTTENGGVGKAISFFQGTSTTPIRFTATGSKIPGIREGRGIKTVGELAAIDYYTGTGTALAMDWDNSASRLANLYAAGTASPAPANLNKVAAIDPRIVTSKFFQIDTNVGSTNLGRVDTNATRLGSDEPGSYAAKLAIATALSNVTTTRSDVFIVWFLVHGYTPEDTQVEGNQPMVPSIAKRYVMVVDRSNVVKKGDKPQVLMMREVPLP